MNDGQRALIVSTALGNAAPDEVLSAFGTGDGAQLGLDLLRDAVTRCDATDVEMALVVGFTFGFTDAHLPLLIDLATASWHQRHEDVVRAIDPFHSPTAIAALVDAAQWVPGYLDFDENRALAVKAVWALGNIPGQEAVTALRGLLAEPDPIVHRGAAEQLRRRGIEV